MSKTPVYLILLFVLIAAVACGGSPTAETVTVKETVEVPVTVEVTRLVETEVTRLVEVPGEPVEVTRIVEATAVPEAEEAAAEPSSGGVKIGMNYVAEVENAGLRVQVARVLIANKADVPIDFTGSPVEDLDVVGEVLYIVTNESDQTINVYPGQGTVQINSELIDLFDYWLMSLGDSIDGEIPPGVQLIGGQWFGIKRNAPEDVKEVTIRFPAPSDPDTYDNLGDDFEIVVDLSEQTFEPIPSELE